MTDVEEPTPGGGQVRTKRCGKAMRDVLIQDDGTAREIDTFHSESQMHGLTPSEYVNYCVKNLGWARLRYNERHVVVHFRPWLVSDVAVASMCYVLIDLNPDRFGLVFFRDSEWQHELCTDLTHGFKRIEALLDESRLKQEAESYISELTPGDLSTEHPFRGQLYQWKLRPSWREFSATLEAASTATNGRFVLFDYSSEHSSFRFADYGDGMPECAMSFLQSAQGMPVECAPDTVYGQACRQAYWDVAERLQPKLQAVDAYVTWPGYGKLRRRYTRLLMPLIDRSGRSWLLSSSLAV